MKLIVGLGNPGDTYKNTRHNVGFLCLDYYLEKENIKMNFDSKFNAIIGSSGIGENKIYYAKPQTYMNLSGEAVYKIAQFYKINKEDILIIYDDMDLELSAIRLRENGSAGGHNGMKNIILQMASQDLKRVRIGISGHKDIDAKDYVLGHFSKEELTKLEEVKEKVYNIISEFNAGIRFQLIMGKYNYKGDDK